MESMVNSILLRRIYEKIVKQIVIEHFKEYTKLRSK